MPAAAISRTIAFTGSDEKRASGAPATLGASTGCAPSLSGMRASMRLTATRSTEISARPPGEAGRRSTMSGECSTISRSMRSAAPANVTGSTAVTSVSGPAHSEATSRTASPDGFDGVAGEGLEAGEQDVVTGSAYEACASVLVPRETPSPRHPMTDPVTFDVSRAPDHRGDRDGARRVHELLRRRAHRARRRRRDAGAGGERAARAVRHDGHRLHRRSRGGTGCRSPSRGRRPAPRCSPPPEWSRAAGRRRWGRSSSSRRSSWSPGCGRCSAG